MTSHRDSEHIFIVGPRERVAVKVEKPGPGVTVSLRSSGGAGKATSTRSGQSVVLTAPAEVNREAQVEIFCEFRADAKGRLSSHRPVRIRIQPGRRKFTDSMLPDFGRQRVNYRFITLKHGTQGLGLCLRCRTVVPLEGKKCARCGDTPREIRVGRKLRPTR